MALDPQPPVVVNGLSVDVEDYFQVSAFEDVVGTGRWEAFERRVVPNTERLLTLFAQAGVHATFFVLGWVAEREPQLVRRIAEQGHEIAAHGFWHRLVYRQTREQFRDDVSRAKGVLESIVGRPVLGYRAPSFSITRSSLWALRVLDEEGYVYDASVFPIRHDRYGIPDAPRHPCSAVELSRRLDGQAAEEPFPVDGEIVEIPASTVRLGSVNLPVSGGGYFRILPYAWTRWSIRRVNGKEGRPVVFYLHPWEVDPLQPRIAASALSAFRHYRHLGQTETRLRRLLGEFRFDTIGTAFLSRHEAAGATLPAAPGRVVAEGTGRIALEPQRTARG